MCGGKARCEQKCAATSGDCLICSAGVAMRVSRRQIEQSHVSDTKQRRLIRCGASGTSRTTLCLMRWNHEDPATCSIITIIDMDNLPLILLCLGRKARVSKPARAALGHGRRCGVGCRDQLLNHFPVVRGQSYESADSSFRRRA
jgi:hypothetical protein